MIHKKENVFQVDDHGLALETTRCVKNALQEEALVATVIQHVMDATKGLASPAHIRHLLLETSQSLTGDTLLPTKQQEIIHALFVKPTIDEQEEIRKRIDFLKNYVKTTSAKGFVLGISGGQDSTLAGKLAQLAVEELRNEGKEATFVAVRLPSGVQQDEADAQAALDFIQPDEIATFDIATTVEQFKQSFAASLKQPLGDFHTGNAKARTRMMVQYAIGGERNLLVIGTDHAAESVTGFFTKYGDGGADILPLAGLTKRQGKALLVQLELPLALLEKTPTADLLEDQPMRTDEDELGIRYEEIDDYLEGKAVSEAAAAIIEQRYNATAHKRRMPITPFDK